MGFNPLNAELNLICHLLALLGAHPILHISMIKVNSGFKGLSRFLRRNFRNLRLLSSIYKWPQYRGVTRRDFSTQKKNAITLTCNYHGAGSLVPPFRSPTFRIFFSCLPRFLLPIVCLILLSSVICYKAFCLYFATCFLSILVFCPKLDLYRVIKNKTFWSPCISPIAMGCFICVNINLVIVLIDIYSFVVTGGILFKILVLGANEKIFAFPLKF